MINNYNLQDITYNLINKINFSNKNFITRFEDEYELINDETFLSLVNSIEKLGLLNPIYLIEKDNEYIVIAGYLRALAIKEILKKQSEIFFLKKAIIYNSSSYDKSLLNISIDENFKRKSLSILELSYKFNQVSETEGCSIDDCLKKFNIGKTQFHAIKKALNFNSFIKESVLEKVGPIKADLLNKILETLLIKESQESAQLKINHYMNKTRDELKKILNNLESNNNKDEDIFEFKNNKNGATLRIKQEISSEDYIKIKSFIKNLLKN